MCRKTTNRGAAANLRHQDGFSLPVAILAVVLLSVLGAAMIELTSTGHRSVSGEVVGTRAFYAAESGAQYALGRLFPLNGGAASCAAASVNFSPPGLEGCTATITCSGPTNLNGRDFYALTSTGQCASGDNQATRVVQVGARAP